MKTLRLVVAAGAVVTLSLTVASPVLASCGALGEWGLTVEWPQRTAEVRLEVTARAEGEIDVRWTGPQGELTGVDGRCTDAALSFDLEVEDAEGRAIRLRFDGKAEGDALEGALHLPNGSEVHVEGRRAKGPASSP